jgi:hypothetical protein
MEIQRLSDSLLLLGPHQISDSFATYALSLPPAPGVASFRELELALLLRGVLYRYGSGCAQGCRYQYHIVMAWTWH